MQWVHPKERLGLKSLRMLIQPRLRLRLSIHPPLNRNIVIVCRFLLMVLVGDLRRSRVVLLPPSPTFSRRSLAHDLVITLIHFVFVISTHSYQCSIIISHSVCNFTERKYARCRSLTARRRLALSADDSLASFSSSSRRVSLHRIHNEKASMFLTLARKCQSSTHPLLVPWVVRSTIVRLKNVLGSERARL